VRFIDPEDGVVACGDVGKGRLADPKVIVEAIRTELAAVRLARELRPAAAAGKPARPRRILVTAGPTREAVDAVRYLSNRSSGKMGYAVAAVAAAAGHEVTLISGPVALPPPAGCRIVRVETAADMAAAVKHELLKTDLLVMAAAVADYRPARPAAGKLKKSAAARTLDLEPTEDILAAVAKLRKKGQKIAGFAAETSQVAEHARAKLAAKKLDWIVANDVSRQDIGFDSNENEVAVFTAGSAAAPRRLPKMPKTELAGRLLEIFLAE